MRLNIPFYEGDGYLHHRAAPAPQAAPAEQSQPRLDSRNVEQQASTLRRDAVSDLIQKLGRWLQKNVRGAVSTRQREIEAYLAKSADHADLERRVKELERNDRVRFC